MKYRANSQDTWHKIKVKALDGMPVGSIVDYDGQVSDIPSGWEQVGDNIVVLYDNPTGAGQEANITLSDDIDNYTYFLFLGFDKDNANTGIQMFFFKQPNSKLMGDKCEVSSTGYSITTRTYTYSGKDLTYSSQYYYTTQQGSVFSYPNFRVQKVIGYK